MKTKQFAELPTEEFSQSTLNTLYKEAESKRNKRKLFSMDLIQNQEDISLEDKKKAMDEIYKLMSRSSSNAADMYESMDLSKVEAYLGQYFFRCENDIYLYYDVDTKCFKMYNYTAFNHDYVNYFKHPPIKYWFNSVRNEHNELYRLDCDPQAPFLKGRTINTFTPIGHPIKDYNKYSKATKEKVELFLDFIKTVICSSKETEYEFMINYLASICQYKQTGVILYLKSVEGTGKSTFCDFIFDYLMNNKHIVLKANKELLTSGYTGSLMGKSIAYFEELPSFTKSQQEGVKVTLNDLCTSPMRSYTEKHVKQINNVKNFINIIVTTNFEALCSLSRRMHRCDISTCRREDHKYFGKLKKQCYSYEVGEAMFNYLRVIDTSKFNGQDKKYYTDAKVEMINKRLPPTYQFLKHEYILRQKDIVKVKKFDFYKQFLLFVDFYNADEYLDEIKYKPDKSTFYKQLLEINIKPKASGGNYYYKGVSHETLYDHFKKQSWICDDDYEVNSQLYKNPNTVNNKTYSDAGIVQGLKDENQELNGGIEKLKAKVAALQKANTKLKAKPTTKVQKYKQANPDLYKNLAAAIHKAEEDELTTSEDDSPPPTPKKKKTKKTKKTKSKKAKKTKNKRVKKTPGTDSDCEISFYFN